MATNKKPVILCKNCGRRIHQIGPNHQQHVKYKWPVGKWVHYPNYFGGHYEAISCMVANHLKTIRGVAEPNVESGQENC